MRGKLAFGAAWAALLMFAPSALAQQQADPPGDSTTTVQLAASADGAIAPAGDVDWYRLPVQQGHRYRITLDGIAGADGQALDTMLGIYGADGNQLAFNDDAGGSLNSALSYSAPQNGDVFVEARAFSDQATGAYHINVVDSVAGPDDVGNDAGTRARFTPGTAATGSIETEGDVDWYRMSVRIGQRYHFTLAGAGDEPLGDTVLRVLSRDGAELAVNDDAGDGTLNSALDFTPEQGGDVFLEVKGYGDTYVGSYTLNGTVERAPTDNVRGDRSSGASLAIGRDVNGSIDFPADKDWYRVRLQGGQSYRFALNSGEGETALGDPVIAIHGADGAELATDDDGGPGLNSYLEFTAPSSGTYYLEARAFDESSATGNYVLSARAGDIPDDASTDAVLSADGDYRDGALSPAGDHDWYRIDLTEGQGMRVSVNAAEGADALSDPLVILHGPDGAQILQDDDSGEGLNAWFEYQAAAAGAYYVEVRGFGDDATGRYVLSVTPGEIGNNAEGAEYIQAGTEGRTGRINTPDDTDWFALDLVEGRPYRFYADGAGEDPLADPVITLYDSDGKPVATDDDGGSGVNAYLNYTSVSGGTFYAAVSSFNNAGAGQYTLRVADTDVPGNANTDEALDASADDDRIGHIDIAGDLDDYRVDVEAGVHYVIELNRHGDDALGDPMLKVLTADGTETASDDDGGSGRNARIRFTPEETGTFILQASGLGGSTGWYQITIVRQQ